MSDSLAVWMHGLHVATIQRRSPAKMSLEYTDAALTAYPLGTPLLSQKLPLTKDRYANHAVKTFFDGLLPEEEQRRLIAQDLDIKVSDTYSIIEAIGRDCAGAVVILPASIPLTQATRTAVPLTESELSLLVANLRDSPLGVSASVRLSLAGVQEKLVLTRTPEGLWERPDASVPSTHILKPDNTRYPQIVDNEVFCMRLAKHLGIPTASVATTEINDRNLIVVDRFDRIRSGDEIQRIHQEDLCQALGLPPSKKYEEDGGPSFLKVARFLDDVVGRDSLDTLAQILVLNVLIGNCDAHAKNLSLLYQNPGIATLAPTYDLLSSELYGENTMAMYIDTVRSIRNVTSDRIVNEVAGWSLSVGRARDLLGDVLGRAAMAAVTAVEETPNAPQELVRRFHRRLKSLQATL